MRLLGACPPGRAGGKEVSLRYIDDKGKEGRKGGRRGSMCV